MFEKRLTTFWILLTVLAVAIVGRLVQIQVAQAEQYHVLAERILTRVPIYLAAPRGTIRDRHGTPLLSDEPTFEVAIHYALIGNDDQRRRRYLTRVAERLRRRGVYPEDMKLREIVEELRLIHVPRMWTGLSRLTGKPEAEIAAAADKVRRRIEAWRRACGGEPIREENQLLPIMENVDPRAALAIRLELEALPWLRVVPGTRRVAHHADALVHVLGRLGAASAERIAADPLRDDELRGLRSGGRCGISGLEYVAESSLRGQRGRIIEDYDRKVLERRDPLPGHDVTLSIDLDLQQHVLDLLEQAVENITYPAGAAAVVIDVETREVRALVSYPVYHYDSFNEDFDRLRRDRKRLPTLFRAVQAHYPPGSICKAITLIGGLSEGVVTPHTRFHCTGFLLPSRPDRFRCWIYRLNPGVTHDMIDDPEGQDAESAVRNSCNIYFFKVGGLLGPERLCQWFGRFGLGRTQGTGLIEESTGVLPTEQWLMDPARLHPRRYQTADAWNFAIGQGEVTCTPLQAANVAATIASGYWAPVRLAYDDTGRALGADAAAVQPFDENHLRVLRRGMWRVVNEPGGTANKWAAIDSQDYELCGKTGSAQAELRVVNTRYICEWPDGQRQSVIALSKEEALARFPDEKPKIVGWRANERYPALHEGETNPSHAWFMGYTQPKSTPRGAAPHGRVYAISVLVEFGVSGGRVAGPVARQIAEHLVNTE